MLRLTPVMLAAALAGCGGGSAPGLRDPARLEAAVRSQLEQRLMGANPRQESAQSRTHIQSVDCRLERRLRYRCDVEFGDGTTGEFPVVVTRDGKRFEFA
jgi:hypothetical protein